MKSYPMQFSVVGQSTYGTQSNWTSSSIGNKNQTSKEIPIAIPPEFDGPGDGYSPEDLYALALQNCFIATFKVFAEKSKLKYTAIEANSVLTLDRDQNGKPWMALFHLQIILKGVEHIGNARRILDKVSSNCMILNSVQTQKTFDFKIEST